jgi:Ca-activated chloride channel homolog
MTSFRFQDPWWLLLLVPILTAAVAILWRRPRASVLFSSVAALRGLPKTWAQRIKRFLPWIFLAGLAALAIALARPQSGKEEFRIRAEGIAIEMAVDRSGSMRGEDFLLDGRPVTRLQAVKKVFRDFVAGDGDLPGRPDDQIGLSTFCGFPEAKCPLTFDHHALLSILEDVEVPVIRAEAANLANSRRDFAQMMYEETSTAMGDGLMTAVDQLKPIKAKSKVIILLSDGRSNSGEVHPLDAAKAAKTLGIKIYTIGIGSTADKPVPWIDPLGNRGFLPPGESLDEKTLTAIALSTGGKYFNADNTESLRKVYAEIDRLEKTAAEGRRYTQYRELFSYALFPGLGLILLEIALVSTRFRSLP